MTIPISSERRSHVGAKQRSGVRRPVRKGGKASRGRHPVGGLVNGWAIVLILAAGIALHNFPQLGDLISDRMSTLTGGGNVSSATHRSAAVAAGIEHAGARAMPICGDGRRVNCVVDGDTIWIDREKIRLETIDAPEVHGQCDYETDLAAAATQRLSALLSQRDMSIRRSGRDVYGRTLARVSIAGGEVGEALAQEGLARRWSGHRKPWCSA